MSHKQQVVFATDEVYDQFDRVGHCVGMSRHLIELYGQRVAAEALLITEGDFETTPRTWYRGIRPSVLFRAMDRLIERRYAVLPETRVWLAKELIDQCSVKALIPLAPKLIHYYERTFDFLKPLVEVEHA